MGLKQPEILILGVTVGHARKIVTNRTFDFSGTRTLGIAFRHLFRPATKLRKQQLQEALALAGHARDPVMTVDALLQESFQAGFEGPYVRTGDNQAFRQLTRLL